MNTAASSYLGKTVLERCVLTNAVNSSIVVLCAYCGDKGYRVAIIANQRIIRKDIYIEIVWRDGGWVTDHPTDATLRNLPVYRDWDFQPCTLRTYLNRYV